MHLLFVATNILFYICEQKEVSYLLLAQQKFIKMKNTKFFTLCFMFLFAGMALNAQTFTVDTEASNMHWLGQKVSGSHEGDIKIKDGSLMLEDGKMSGIISIDMTSMTCTDIEDETYNQKLIGHLMADDFFSVEENPTATFEIKEANKVYRSDATHEIVGDLTIKGITNEIKIPATVEMDSDAFAATAKFSIDRTLWDIQYGSGGFFDGLGDKMIYDDIQFDLSFKANPKKK